MLFANSTHHSLNFSTPVDWDDLPQHLAKFGLQIEQFPGNGKCFIESVKWCMLHDIGVNLEDEDIRNITLDEMYRRIDFYSAFHPNIT